MKKILFALMVLLSIMIVGCDGDTIDNYYYEDNGTLKDIDSDMVLFKSGTIEAIDLEVGSVFITCKDDNCGAVRFATEVQAETIEDVNTSDVNITE